MLWPAALLLLAWPPRISLERRRIHYRAPLAACPGLDLHLLVSPRFAGRTMIHPNECGPGLKIDIGGWPTGSPI